VVRLWTSGQAFSGRADELGDDGSGEDDGTATEGSERGTPLGLEASERRLSCTEGQVHAFILENSCESRLFMICCVCSITSTHYIIGVITNRKYLCPKKLS
jgi:hypothetical protein